MRLGLTQILLGAIAVLAAGLALQTWRLDRCQVRAAGLQTCEEVDELEQEVRDETDDDLADRVSDPR